MSFATRVLVSIRRLSRRTFSTHFQIFLRRVRIFSLFFLCCFYFLLKVHVNFSSVFYRDYRAVVTSSRRRPFCFHNSVFLLNCLFLLYNAHIIFVCVIAVSKSHEFCWKFVDCLHFFSTTTPTPSRRHVFFSTTTQGIRLRRRVDVFTTTSDTSSRCFLFPVVNFHLRLQFFCSQLTNYWDWWKLGLRDFICKLPAWKLIWIYTYTCSWVLRSQQQGPLPFLHNWKLVFKVLPVPSSYQGG